MGGATAGSENGPDSVADSVVEATVQIPSKEPNILEGACADIMFSESSEEVPFVPRECRSSRDLSLRVLSAPRSCSASLTSASQGWVAARIRSTPLVHELQRELDLARRLTFLCCRLSAWHCLLPPLSAQVSRRRPMTTTLIRSPGFIQTINSRMPRPVQHVTQVL